MFRPDLEDLVQPTRWPELGWRAYFAIALVLIFAPPLACTARAQIMQVDCRELALLVTTATWAREVGADRERVVASLEAMNVQLGKELAAAVGREIRAAWNLGRPIPDTAQAVYESCRARLGDLGRGS